MSVIVIGDDAALPVTLKRDGAVFSIDAGATVQAVLVSSDETTVLSPVVTCNNAAAGADWANSLVVVEFAAADTAQISGITKATTVVLEIQVDDVVKNSWFAVVTVKPGHIY